MSTVISVFGFESAVAFVDVSPLREARFVAGDCDGAPALVLVDFFVSRKCRFVAGGGIDSTTASSERDKH